MAKYFFLTKLFFLLTKEFSLKASNAPKFTNYFVNFSLTTIFNESSLLIYVKITSMIISDKGLTSKHFFVLKDY